MTEEEKKVDGQTAEPAAQKKKKKWPIVVGVVVAVLDRGRRRLLGMARAAELLQRHLPHARWTPTCPPMRPSPARPPLDVWGNEVANASGMMAAVHRAQNGTTCLGCHVPTLSEQIGRGHELGHRQLRGLNTQTGQQVVPEKSWRISWPPAGIERRSSSA